MIFNSPYKKLNRKINTWCKYTTRLDTYGCGCQHDCQYCYARGLLYWRGFFDTCNPAIANIEYISNKIRRIDRYEVVRIGGMTDCFQPIELKYRITYNSIRLLNYLKISYLIVTKSDLVATDEYIKLYDPYLAHFQISISSTDDSLAFKYERATPISNRIKAIEKLFSLGFDVSVRLSPYLYNNIDLHILNKIKCNKILIEFLKANWHIKQNFNIDYTDYSLKYGGYDNLQLDRKIELIKNIEFEQCSVGEYVKDHYLYFRDNYNFNKTDCCNLNLRQIETVKQLTFDYEKRYSN